MFSSALAPYLVTSKMVSQDTSTADASNSIRDVVVIFNFRPIFSLSLSSTLFGKTCIQLTMVKPQSSQAIL